MIVKMPAFFGKILKTFAIFFSPIVNLLSWHVLSHVNLPAGQDEPEQSMWVKNGQEEKIAWQEDIGSFFKANFVVVVFQDAISVWREVLLQLFIKIK